MSKKQAQPSTVTYPKYRIEAVLALPDHDDAMSGFLATMEDQSLWVNDAARRVGCFGIVYWITACDGFGELVSSFGFPVIKEALSLLRQLKATQTAKVLQQVLALFPKGGDESAVYEAIEKYGAKLDKFEEKFGEVVHGKEDVLERLHQWVCRHKDQFPPNPKEHRVSKPVSSKAIIKIAQQFNKLEGEELGSQIAQFQERQGAVFEWIREHLKTTGRPDEQCFSLDLALLTEWAMNTELGPLNPVPPSLLRSAFKENDRMRPALLQALRHKDRAKLKSLLKEHPQNELLDLLMSDLQQSWKGQPKAHENVADDFIRLKTIVECLDPVLAKGAAARTAQSARPAPKLGPALRAWIAEQLHKEPDALSEDDLRDVHELSLMFKTASDRDLEGLEKLTELNWINLGHTSIGDRTAKAIARLKHLRELDVWQTKLTAPGLKHLAALKHLEALRLDSLPVNRNFLCSLGKMKKLRELTLASCPLTGQELVGLTGLSSLRHLVVSSCPVTDRGLEILVRLETLQVLDLARTQVTNAGMKFLPKLTALQGLQLSETQVGDAGAREIGRIATLKNLSLRQTKITDAGIADLASLQQLESLILDKTEVSDAGLQAVASLRHLFSLSIGETKVTPAGIRKLRKLKPNLHIQK